MPPSDVSFLRKQTAKNSFFIHHKNLAGLRTASLSRVIVGQPGINTSTDVILTSLLRELWGDDLGVVLVQEEQHLEHILPFHRDVNCCWRKFGEMLTATCPPMTPFWIASAEQPSLLSVFNHCNQQLR
jgi:hypothetical protein